jgi:hypothetical protein
LAVIVSVGWVYVMTTSGVPVVSVLKDVFVPAL